MSVPVGVSVTPATAFLTPGQTMQFAANALPAGDAVQWTVSPATGGTISSTGLFTASTTQGVFSIQAKWTCGVEATWSAQVTILPPPPPVVVVASEEQASGNVQASTGNALTNETIVGELIQPTICTGPPGSGLLAQTGFDLSDAH